MKFLNELVGFAVLTTPLWLILILLAVSVWVAVKLVGRFEQRSTKIGAGIGILLFLFFVPFADALVGRVYLNHLCASEGGAKVYQTVELPAGYWGTDGSPTFLKSNGSLDKSILGNRFSAPAVKVPYSSTFAIDQYRQKVVDNVSQQTLGEVINFLHWGGWIFRTFAPHPSASDCKSFHGTQFWRDFYLSLFTKL